MTTGPVPVVSSTPAAVTVLVDREPGWRSVGDTAELRVTPAEGPGELECVSRVVGVREWGEGLHRYQLEVTLAVSPT